MRPVPPKQSVLLGLLPAAGTLAAYSLAASLVACNNRQSLVVPNRVLDRPTDMVMACLRRDPLTEIIAPTSLNRCVDATCGELRLVGFVANSERDDIAMFSKCANSVLDMDEATPGAQLIPAGKVPTSMTITSGDTNGCFAVSANLGSCDLSMLDVPGLSAYAFDDVPARDPSELVLAVTPTRGNGSPLGARPGQVLAVPPELSNSVLFGELEGDTDTTGDDGTGEDAGAESTGTGGNEIRLAICDADRPGSVYVTFPSCQLIAEVDLRTQRILQSRQFARDPMSGDLIVKDTGVDPLCPIDCPELFADDPGILDDAPPGEVDGMYPSAMALIEKVRNPEDLADEEIRDPALFVGGLGADTLFELRYDNRRWVTDPLVLDLQDASGISAIRPTPVMALNVEKEESFHQFLYVIAGDGSTRVVRRELDDNRSEIGRECDTQVDPTAVLDLVCHPAEFPGENPPDRRPFARGPGIRGPNGSLITDWTFQKVPKLSNNNLPDPGIARSPFGKAGVTGVGTTSFGRLVFVTFDQFNTDPSGKNTTTRISNSRDPLGLLDARIQPHMLWPTLDPFAEPVDITALPRVEDAPPQRLLPGEVEGPSAIKALAPALRRIDMAYAGLAVPCKYTDADDTDDAACIEETNDKAARCANDNQCHGLENPLLSPYIPPDGGDGFGNPDLDGAGSNGLYKNEAVRAVVRDYRSWIPGNWTLYWEGEIPDTSSFTGQLVCEHPGWNGGTCLSTEPGDTRIVDTNARFCDAGVLAGDKLTLFGCASDTDCGVGQFCLTDPRTPTNGTGICVSQSAYDEKENLLTICEDLIYDPCGSPVREFLITGAFQNELWLQAMDQPETAYLMDSDVPLAEIPLDPNGVDPEGEDPDRLDAETVLCHGKYLRDLADDAPDPSIHRNECERRLVCAPEQPETGCETHTDCVDAPAVDGEPAPESYPLCIDGLCRRACREGEDCVLRRLPGPACVQELVRYLVQGRNSFIVRGSPGSAYDFLDQRVRADESGECYEDPTISNLLTSRIRLGSDETDTRNNTAWPIPTCPPSSDRPGAGVPNPCFIDTPRPDGLSLATPGQFPVGLFHYFKYGLNEDGGQIPAIRFSNPMMSIVLDLTSLDGLIEPIPGTEGATWKPEFRKFHRSRIPRAFNESFSTVAGYSPFDIGVVTSSISLVGPTRLINAPELGQVYIVDTAGGTGTGGVRGQVVRVGLIGGQSSPDEKFLVH